MKIGFGLSCGKESMDYYARMSWHDVKAVVRDRPEVWCRPGSVWWTYWGENIGAELNGKGEEYLRPVIILTSFSKKMCFVIPLTSQRKKGNHSIQIKWKNHIGDFRFSNALLRRARVISTKRLKRIAGTASPETLQSLIQKYTKQLNTIMTAPLAQCLGASKGK